MVADNSHVNYTARHNDEESRWEIVNSDTGEILIGFYNELNQEPIVVKVCEALNVNNITVLGPLFVQMFNACNIQYKQMKAMEPRHDHLVIGCEYCEAIKKLEELLRGAALYLRGKVR